MKFDICFVTTCTDDKNIRQLVRSITTNNNHINILLIIVIQQGLDFHFDETENTKILIIHRDSLLPLSCARNIALRELLKSEIDFDYMMFPDDDSSFDELFFKKFKSKVQGNSLIDVYGSGSRILFRKNPHKDGDKLDLKDYRYAMSVNMLLTKEILSEVGFFDERLGVGAYYGSGEDTDYYIRCWENGADFRYNKQLWNYHPLSNNKSRQQTLRQLIKRYNTYGRGMIFTFIKHKMYLEALKCSYCALAGSFVALMKGDCKLSLARLCAFFTRSKTYLSLLCGNKINK